ncbi:hypothetical protein PG993_004477 [Apiospora rasikravindrae]|uniref:Uncharacterized protein n=1 Tax=Apiospora rasikravindrae TaxID=990691 RepID=A0ABR1TCY8_9PEZI
MKLSKLEYLTPADHVWFFQTAGLCAQLSDPTVVLSDFGTGGRHNQLWEVWFSKVFDNGFWDSTMEPSPPGDPKENGIEGCVLIGRFKEDLPQSAEDETAWLEVRQNRGPDEPMGQSQSDQARKKNHPAYLRLRTNKLGNSLVVEYVDAKLRWAPEDLIEFREGAAPNFATQAKAMRVQDDYQLRCTGTWNVKLLVYLFPFLVDVHFR